MDYSSSPRRRYSDDLPPGRYRSFSNGQVSPERRSHSSRRGSGRNEDDFDVSYGGQPVLAHSTSWESHGATDSYDFLSTSPRTLSSISGSYIADQDIGSATSFVEGIENDGTRVEEIEDAGLSRTVTLPTNNEKGMLYTSLTDTNPAWKEEKYYDKKIGTTTLQSIYSMTYSTGEMGQAKITLFCPEGPIRDNEDSASVQAKWLHVQRSSMSVKVLEKLVMDCPIINADIQKVAILLLEAVNKSYLRESENGAYIEPGSVLRFTGTRHLLHGPHNFLVTEPVVFIAFPFVELASSRNHHEFREEDDFYPRTLLQNLYGFDVVTSRGKNQVIHKMPVNSQPNDALFVNQLWCLVIGSDILITLSDRPADDLLGDAIEKRTDYFRQPLRIEVVDVNGLDHSMSISSKTPWVAFFRHVIYTIYGNLIRIMDYELVDQAGEVVTTERWAELARATRSSLLKFRLAERKVPVSRSSSVSSRRSSNSGIRRLLLDYTNHNNRRSSKASASRYQKDRYDGDSSSSERMVPSKRASTPGRLRFSRSSMDKSPVSTENARSRMNDDRFDKRKEASTSQSKPAATMYRKVQVEDGSESSDEDEIDGHPYNDPTDTTLPSTSTKLSFKNNVVFKGKHNFDANDLSELDSRERSPETRFVFRNNTSSFSRDSSPETYRSRSSSLSDSPNDSLYSRGRSRTRKRRDRRWQSRNLAHDSSSRPEVRFQPQEWHSSNRDSAETSPFGSSNATKVEARPLRTTVPFFFWKRNSVSNTFSTQDTPEQVLIKLLDQIDERISGDPISRYYLKVPELTMGDVLSRQESLEEASSEKDSTTFQNDSSQVDKSVGQGTIDIRTSNRFAYFRLSEIQIEMTDKGGGDKDKNEIVEAFNTTLDNDSALKPKASEGDNKPAFDSVASPTNVSPGRGAYEQKNFSQTQALGLVSHDKALAKQLVEMSQQIISSFIPDTGGSVIHTLLKRLWGCVDIMCLQLLWEENQRGRDSECTYIIRNFSSQAKKTDLPRRKPISGKIHYLACDDCKLAKPYQSAVDALSHLHERHIECKHSESDRPYDDPCYVWLHRIWHDGYPMRSSRDGLLGIMEDFIEELSYISNYVRELQNMTAKDFLAGDEVSTPPLSMNITHAFQQIVKMFVFRSKQMSLRNRQRMLSSGSSLGNFPLIQRIDQKIDELVLLEMNASERIIGRLESAKKDIFLSGIESHSEMLEAETVRVQFLALAFMSGMQRPLLQPSVIGRSYVKDTLLQLYKDYTSRLHFQANNRPQKRVFLDIHGLEEELQAWDKLVDSQESCVYNVLALIDPITSRYTTETRFREFRVEAQFGNDQLHQLIERRREIDNLSTRLWILKDQVKQTIEIMEEDHGKAIRVFTVVTLFFLPLSFVSSFLGMNTADVRNSKWNQSIFWITGIPITVAVLSIAFIYGYRGEEIRDWMDRKRDRSHQDPPATFHEMTGRTSLDTRPKDWNSAIMAEQNVIRKRGFKSLVRSRIENVPGWGRQINGTLRAFDGFDGRASVRRRNTEDSLAPMRD